MGRNYKCWLCKPPKDKKVNYYKIPEDEKMRKLWLEACNRHWWNNKIEKSPLLLPQSRICSEHFLKDSYWVNGKLKNTAIPFELSLPFTRNPPANTSSTDSTGVGLEGNQSVKKNSNENVSKTTNLGESDKVDSNSLLTNQSDLVKQVQSIFAQQENILIPVESLALHEKKNVPLVLVPVDSLALQPASTSSSTASPASSPPGRILPNRICQLTTAHFETPQMRHLMLDMVKEQYENQAKRMCNIKVRESKIQKRIEMILDIVKDLREEDLISEIGAELLMKHCHTFSTEP